MLWIILGSACLAYYAAIEYFSEGQPMTVVWIILAAIFLACYLWREYRKRRPAGKRPLWFRTFCVTSLCLLLVLLGVTMSRIVLGLFPSPEPDLDYIVILAQQDIEGESDTELVKRLDAAVAYLQQNPDTSVIVSGGWEPAQGSSGARVMYQYLLRHGVERERIFWETYSTDTEENLYYSMVIAGGRQARMGVVSSDYFAYRACRVARNLGIADVQSIPAGTTAWLLPHRLVTELLCVLEDKFLGI